MLFLLALPIFLSVAATHRYLALYAPSNILVRWVRMSQPRWRTVGALAAFASVLLVAMRAVEVAVTAGAPDWLNVVALVLAWDAIKVVGLAIHSGVRTALRMLSPTRIWRIILGPVSGHQFSEVIEGRHLR
jgi:hypothetical protein